MKKLRIDGNLGNQNLEIYNLNYAGTFKEIKKSPSIEIFNLYNILAIYIYRKRKMFIWIGKNASNSLKIYIPNIRELFFEEFPDKKILRNITIESGFETTDFLENFNFNKLQLDEHIRNQEEKVNPILSMINEIKEHIEKLIKGEKYDEAISKSEEIIKLSQKIEDKALENDQENLIERLKELKRKKEIEIISRIDDLKIIEKNNFRIGHYIEAIKNAREIINIAKTADLDLIVKEEEDFIARLSGKYNPQQLMVEVREKSVKLKSQYEMLIFNNKIKEAHDLVIDLVNKYGRYCDLLKIPSARYLLDKDRVSWKKYSEEKEKIIIQLEELEKEYIQAIEVNNIKKATKILDYAWDLVFSLNDEELIKKWAQIEEDYSLSSQEIIIEGKSELINEIQQLLKIEGKLLNKVQLNEGISKLQRYQELAKQNNLNEFHNSLSIKIKELIVLSDEYEEYDHKIKILEEKLMETLDYKEYDKATIICKELIDLSRKLNYNALIETYNDQLIQLQTELKIIEDKEHEKVLKLKKIEHFKIDLKSLAQKGKNSFFEGNLSESLEIYKKIIILFQELKQ